MRSSGAVAGALLVVAVSAAHAARAAPLVVGFAGTVAEIADPEAVLGGAVAVGDRFSGQVRFDPEGVEDAVSDPQIGVYADFPKPADLRLELGDLDLALGNLRVQVGDDIQSGQTRSDGTIDTEDRLAFVASEALPAFTPLVAVALADPSSDRLDSDALLTDLLSLSKWSGGSLSVKDVSPVRGGQRPPLSSLQLSGSLDRLEVVPEPSAGLLATAGLALLGTLRRTRRRPW